jgi:hypothetical protein
MLATKRKLKRDRMKAKRQAEWKDYGAYKADCRRDGLTVMSFEDWKAPKKKGSE